MQGHFLGAMNITDVKTSNIHKSLRRYSAASVTQCFFARKEDQGKFKLQLEIKSENAKLIFF